LHKFILFHIITLIYNNSDKPSQLYLQVQIELCRTAHLIQFRGALHLRLVHFNPSQP